VNRVLIELALIALAACVGLALAWAHQADFFAISCYSRGTCHRRSSSAVSVKSTPQTTAQTSGFALILLIFVCPRLRARLVWVRFLFFRSLLLHSNANG
jgi:hypothetical protein